MILWFYDKTLVLKPEKKPLGDTYLNSESLQKLSAGKNGFEVVFQVHNTSADAVINLSQLMTMVI